MKDKFLETMQIQATKEMAHELRVVIDKIHKLHGPDPDYNLIVIGALFMVAQQLSKEHDDFGLLKMLAQLIDKDLGEPA